MAQHEKDPENPFETRKKSPEPELPLPEDLPPAAAELVDDIDNYQKRMEAEWETAKTAYEDKINRIMDDFMGDLPPSPRISESIQNKEQRKKFDTNNERLNNLMRQVEKELGGPARRESLQLGWKDSGKRSSWHLWGALAGLGVLLAGAVFYWMFWKVEIIPLPYTHTQGPVLLNDRVYILDWFRRSLYVHQDAIGFPIRAVEPVPNTLSSGLALSANTLWSLDSLEKKILFHAVSSDHQVNTSFNTPGGKPVGLFYDGTDLWSADQEEKQLYRFHGKDVEDIRDRYPLPEINLTSFAFYKSRLWILDGKSRLINVYRLQKPMLQIGSFDLDPFLKGASPTGLAMDGRKLVLVTENPAVLIRIPINRLRKSTIDNF